ncbi:MAG: FKBP-type peptidyl-prolyl cis-trans isomerase [Gemmatimonadetes bacterium]|nr:FKBP-type peptidyl-prolyl cis-trans isomerase [Gemmatimonadota bacterium]MBK8059403.1 FKBP-type peptidyl-prolyl cis-trans isomerase [Gemmatimonadota bacterium]MBK8647542.1 FKBP-type peptidyl-prolyl cis-trans isomerase [Gemmatimonadota bacterium]MBK9411067.1 FKBP-type peptidyl-prolyl cis-trans isomerase [Gemmatimonadota bacterium]MBK9976338.1 FKBP-type peptidyl-prolyl cis-trans isomerase [Gemmatimonadota bacterium]
MRILPLVPVAVLAMTAGACASRRAPLPSPIPAIPGTPTIAFALETLEMRKGSGTPMRPRACVYVHYTGWLTDGKKFDSSRDTMPNGQPRTPLAFPQGARRVIAGWDAGFEGMQVGGQRRLIIPYQLGYGELGRPPVIPPKATLVFDVELMAVADTLPTAGAPPLPAGAPPGPQCAPWRAVGTSR